MHESHIRDLIAKNFTQYFPEFKFVGAEYYIKTKGNKKVFIDILASDTQGNYIIIEIKRSNQSARQALHELLKYFQAVKGHFGARDGEIKSIILSTAWDELLIPLSAFLYNTNFSLQGYELVPVAPASQSKKFNFELINPKKYLPNRFFAPYCRSLVFRSAKNRKPSVKSIASVFNQANIENFVCVELRTDRDDVYIHKHFVYVAILRLTIENYKEIIQKISEIDHESLEFDLAETKDLLHEHRLGVYEYHIMSSLCHKIESEFSESGKPGNFSSAINQFDWEVQKIHRLRVYQIPCKRPARIF